MMKSEGSYHKDELRQHPNMYDGRAFSRACCALVSEQPCRVEGITVLLHVRRWRLHLEPPADEAGLRPEPRLRCLLPVYHACPFWMGYSDGNW